MRRRGLVWLAFVGVGLLVWLAFGTSVMAGAGSDPFAGTWETFGGTGRLGLEVVGTVKGERAVAFYSGQTTGPSAKSVCRSGTVYYTGYYSGSSDSGQIAACTDSSGRHLIGWYKSGAGEQHGTISISIDANGTSFSGEYHEQSSVGTGSGTYDGTLLRGATGPGFQYSMPARFGHVNQSTGLIDYLTTPAQIDPPSWRVEFTVSNCNAKTSYMWQVDGRPAVFAREPGPSCKFSHDFPKLGKYKVKLTEGTGGPSFQKDVVVHDWLIVGLGDSNGSGEGTPDIPGLHVTWEDLRCDRSAKSFEAQAALAIEHHDTKTSVTFVHLACSGATIVNGLLGPYDGINPPHAAGAAMVNGLPGHYKATAPLPLGPPLPSQLSALGALIGKRPIDALIVSIGVNDLKFGEMTKFCLKESDCQNQIYPDASSNITLDTWMKEHVAALYGLYDRLAARFLHMGIRPDRIFISQYFDSTHDQNGVTCNPLIRAGPRVFDQSEAAWAYQYVLVPLNAAVAAAAGRHHWNLISGAQQAFRTHGYCSTDPWITGLTDSLANQHDANGTLHANEAGQKVDTGLALNVLLPQLYPGGRPRPPGA